MRLEPTAGVIKVRDEWWYPELGIQVAAPPLVVGDASSPGERESAGRAVNVGMASTEPTGKGSGPFALEFIRVLVVPAGHAKGILAMTKFLVLMHPLGSSAAVIIALVAWILDVSVLWWLAMFLIGAGVSSIVHEGGHLVALRLVAGRTSPALLLATPLSARLVWRSTGSAKDILVIIAGPLAPLLVIIPFTRPLIDAPVAGVSAAVVAVSHAITLALRSGDGAELRAAVRSRKRALTAEGS